jgi:signal transduction histidine kinase
MMRRHPPITLRLTAVFAAVMAVVLAATGLFVYLRLGTELDRTIDESLRSRADDLAAFVQRSGPAAGSSDRRRLTPDDESVAQIVDTAGRVVGSTSTLLARPVLTPAELQRALRGTTLIEREALPALDGDPGRLLATPVTSRGTRLVIVVGASVDGRQEALGDLVRGLLVGGPFALLLATLTAYGVARAALRPVESMRRQAAAISGSEPGRRLPLPPTRDELHRLGETLNAMLARLEAALARERAFVSDASHELRTPLAILSTELELALQEGRTREELRDAVRSASEETARLIRLAEDLLVVARSEQGRLPVRREENDVAAIFDAVVRRAARRARRLGIALEADAPEGLRVRADRMRLEQALGNLVDNALRHGGGRVRLTARQRAGRIELHVLDDGPGFAPGFVDRAFERFSRADEGRGGGGSGLGLAVVDGIAVAHGGSAHAANRDAGGADVWLSLPAEPVPAAAPR